ncbi:hypothetical protein C5S32_11920 [ANME-1 cluster archaeon GoMg1]|nr:hypothetical protein [ANME-1 cluster archaeon GoMg1]
MIIEMLHDEDRDVQRAAVRVFLKIAEHEGQG